MIGKDKKMAIFQKNTVEKTSTNRVIEIPVCCIAPNPAQPRVIFDDYELSQLAVSIQQNGILQPLTVRRLENGLTYELIAGERRLRACKLLNMSYVPCIIIETTNKDSAILAVVENLQRSELNYMEEAYAIKNLIDYYELTQEAPPPITMTFMDGSFRRNSAQEYCYAVHYTGLEQKRQERSGLPT